MAVEREIEIDLGMTKPDDMDKNRTFRAVLELRTGKSVRGGIDSTASVSWKSGSWTSTAIGRDYYLVYERQHNARATQAAIDRQHGRVFTQQNVDNIIAGVKAHYARFQGNAA